MNAESGRSRLLKDWHANSMPRRRSFIKRCRGLSMGNQRMALAFGIAVAKFADRPPLDWLEPIETAQCRTGGPRKTATLDFWLATSPDTRYEAQGDS